MHLFIDWSGFTNAFTQKIVNGLKIFTTLLSLYSYSASILLLWYTDYSAFGKDSRKITGADNPTANKFGNDLFFKILLQNKMC